MEESHNGDGKQQPDHFLSGGGEMGARMREFDWSKTSLGPAEGWPQSLKTAVRIMLASRQPMWLGWGDNLIKLYNDAYKSIVGGKHPEALGQPAAVVWREIWNEIGPMLKTAMGGVEGTYVEAQLLIMERSGYPEETYYTFSYSPIPNDQGSTGGIICANTDDTQRVLGERRLHTLRELAAETAEAKTVEEACELSASAMSRNLYDLPFTLLYLFDAEGKSAHLMRATGLEPGTAASPHEINVTKSAGMSDSWPLRSILVNSQSILLTDLMTRFGKLPGGPWPESSHSAMVLPLAQAGLAAPTGFLIAGISPRLAFDDNYRGFLGLVAGQVATAIGDARAYEAERKRADALAELDRVKTDFFSNVSHEFRTPLTLMLGPLEDALSGALDPAQKQELEIVHRNGLRLLKLVNTLLDFSRIEAGRVQAVYEPTDLARYTAELASTFRSAIERAGMELIVDCPPVPEPVYVDREMWEKIILNLLSNAFKFTLEGTITISLHPADGDVELQVRDTGTGIAEDELPHIFERFHRIRGAQARTHEGTGIGLALVQELVRLHGGNVRVESRLGKGTAFTISIPTGTAHLPADRISAERTLESTALSAKAYVEEALRWIPEEAKSTSQPDEIGRLIAKQKLKDINPARILLADDNNDMREYVKRILSPHWTVEAVSDGQAALDAARERVPDLVLSDVMMPRLDGFELLRELRSSQSAHRVPVILLSARAGEDAQIEGLEAGADDYLVKPFSARELVARVSAHLKIARIRNEAEQVVRANAAQLQTLFDEAPIGVYLIDADFRIRQVNPTAMPVFANIPDLIGRDFDEVIHILWSKEYADEIVRLFRHTLNTGEPYISPERIEKRRDRGVIEYYEWQVNRIPLSDGRYGVVCYFRDISAQVFARQAIAESEERYRSLTGVLTSVVWTTNAEGAFATPQPEWESFTGQTWEEYQGWGWFNALHPDDSERVQALWRQALDTRTVYEAQGRLWHAPSGKYHYYVARATPLFNADGSVREWIGNVLDTQEQKEAEAERDKLLAAERVAREAADAASRAKDEFLATVSHELRSPLNAMLGWARLLSGGNLNEETAARGLKAIEQNAKAQAQLIEDLLDVSRIISGKFRLNNEPVQVARVIEAAIDSVRPTAEAKGVRLQVTLDPDAGPVSGDAGRLQQVVWNILSNAVKFTPRDGRVQVRLLRINSHIEIMVSDTGQGIAPEFLPYVFDRFRQADGSSTRSHGGLGLGLAIVRHITELHGGSVAADSPGKGRGATFTVRLPLMVIHTKHSDEPRVHPRVSGEAVLSFKPSLSLEAVKVLIVDDELESLLLLSTLLTQCGAYVKTASSAEEGFKIVQAWRPDVVVSDIGMPGEDGYAFMNRVKAWARETGTWIPAVALTAYARAEDRMKALASGFQIHVPKPVEPAELIAVLESLVERPPAPWKAAP